MSRTWTLHCATGLSQSKARGSRQCERPSSTKPSRLYHEQTLKDHFFNAVVKTQDKASMDVKRKEMDLLSNSIAAYAHIKANPESFGLYFVIGVCFGLVLTLCLLVIRISCKPRTKTAPSTPEKKQLKDFSEDEEDEESDDEEEDEEDAVDVEVPIPPITTEITMSNHHSSSDGNVNVFTSAEELERAQRLEERERIIREIWRNGQPDILGTGTGTIGRVHYY